MTNAMDVRPGKVEDFVKSSEDKVSLTLIKRDYSGKMLEGVRLEKSLIAKCMFCNAKIFNCEFTDCEFTKDSFAGATLLGVSFTCCTFYSVDFTGAQMSHIQFSGDCRFVNSSLDGVSLGADVVGLSDRDRKVITEGRAAIVKALKGCGFIEVGDGSLELSVGPHVKCSAYFDPDAELWRITYLVNGEGLLTADLRSGADVLSKVKYDLEYVKSKVARPELRGPAAVEIAEIDSFIGRE